MLWFFVLHTVMSDRKDSEDALFKKHARALREKLTAIDKSAPKDFPDLPSVRAKGGDFMLVCDLGGLDQYVHKKLEVGQASLKMYRSVVNDEKAPSKHVDTRARERAPTPRQ